MGKNDWSFVALILGLAGIFTVGFISYIAITKNNQTTATYIQPQTYTEPVAEPITQTATTQENDDIEKKWYQNKYLI